MGSIIKEQGCFHLLLFKDKDGKIRSHVRRPSSSRRSPAEAQKQRAFV